MTLSGWVRLSLTRASSCAHLLNSPHRQHHKLICLLCTGQRRELWFSSPHFPQVYFLFFFVAPDEEIGGGDLMLVFREVALWGAAFAVEYAASFAPSIDALIWFRGQRRELWSIPPHFRQVYFLFLGICTGKIRGGDTAPGGSKVEYEASFALIITIRAPWRMLSIWGIIPSRDAMSAWTLNSASRQL
jgi:hypothetical protein